MERRAGGRLSGVSKLNIPEALVLATAQIEVLANELGVRQLVIKGLVADRMGLRLATDHSDVDVLVERHSLRPLMGALIAAGWRPRPRTRVAAFVEYHSRSFVHENWPIDIDVHVSIPGFLKSPADVFESLWADRQVLNVAGIDVTSIGWEAALLLQEVHGLRSPDSAKSHRERSFLRGEVAGAMDTGRMARVAAVANELGAAYSCQQLLADLGLGSAVVHGDMAERRMRRGWDALTMHPSTPSDRVVGAILMRGYGRSLLDLVAILLGRGLGKGSVRDESRGRGRTRFSHLGRVVRQLLKRVH